MAAAVDMRRINRWIVAGLVLLVGVAFAGALFNGFVRIDDHLYVTENPHVQDGLTVESLRWAVTATTASNWHPLTWWSHQLDWQLFGADPRGPHAVNVLWHAANAVLLFFLLRRVLLVGNADASVLLVTWVAAGVAALFAVHPLRVESVAWVSERKDVLSTFFWLLTLWCYLLYVERLNLLSYLGVTISLALGLLAKPMLVTVPAVMLLLDVWPLRRVHEGPGRWKCIGLLLAEKLPWFALAVASSIVTWQAQSAGGAVLESLPAKVKWANVVASYGMYLARTVWPMNLACFYPLDTARLTERGFADLRVMGSLTVMIALTAGCLWYARTRPYLLIGWLWFVGTLVPVVGIVKVGDQAWADRYSYVPQMGLWLALAAFALDECVRHAAWRRPLAGLAAMLVVVYTALTVRQVATWRDTSTLAEQALRATGENFMGYYLRGVAAQRANDLENATHDFTNAVRLQPNYYPALHDLGVAELDSNNLDAAVKHFRRAADVAPRKAGGYAGQAAVAARRGQLPLARKLLEKAAQLDAGDATLRLNLAAICLAYGDAVAAQGWFNVARRIDAAQAESQHALAAQIEQQLRSAE